MDPTIEQTNLDPPGEPVLSRGLLPALAVNVLLLGALAWGMSWKSDGGDAQPGAAPAKAAESAPVAA
ncbi:MAG TPA: hypothetical protein VEA40_02180, partial [Ramlibacter sp.]|nr:hypothetical protein [Ramlibacter sp.]